jgi:hypothetical protein
LIQLLWQAGSTLPKISEVIGLVFALVTRCVEFPQNNFNVQRRRGQCDVGAGVPRVWKVARNSLNRPSGGRIIVEI